MNKNKSSKLAFIIVSLTMMFAIFMFFMDVLRWTGYYGPGEGPLYSDYTTPTFFNLMFGTGSFDNNPYVGGGIKFPLVPGMLVLFILQVLLSIGAITLLFITFTKKIKEKSSYIFIVVLGLIAVACGVISFFSYSFISKLSFNHWGFTIPFKDNMALNYGAYVYGIVMIVVGLASFLPYVLTNCIKKRNRFLIF